MQNYLGALRRFARHFDADPTTLGDSEVRAHLLYLREVRQLSSTTLRIACVALNRFFHHYLGRDPFPVFSEFRVRERRALPTVLTRGEVSQLLSAVESLRWRSILTLIYGCGLRSSGPHQFSHWASRWQASVLTILRAEALRWPSQANRV